MCKSSIQSTSWLLTSSFKHTYKILYAHTHTHTKRRTRTVWIFASREAQNVGLRTYTHTHSLTHTPTHTHTLWEKAWDRCGCEMPWASLLDSYFIIIRQSISTVQLMMTTTHTHTHTHTHRFSCEHIPGEIQVFSITDMRASARTQTQAAQRKEIPSHAYTWALLRMLN